MVKEHRFFEEYPKKYKMLIGFKYRAKNTAYENLDLTEKEIMKILDTALLVSAYDKKLAGNCYYVGLMGAGKIRGSKSIVNKISKLDIFIEGMDKYQKKYARNFLKTTEVSLVVYQNKSIVDELQNKKIFSDKEYRNIVRKYCRGKNVPDIKDSKIIADNKIADDILNKKIKDYQKITKMLVLFPKFNESVEKTYVSAIEKIVKLSEYKEVKKEIIIFGVIGSLKAESLLNVYFASLMLASSGKEKYIYKLNDFKAREYLSKINSKIQKDFFISCLFKGFSDEKFDTAKKEQFIEDLIRQAYTQNKKRIPNRLKVLAKEVRESNGISKGITPATEKIYLKTKEKMSVILYQYWGIKDGIQRKNRHIPKKKLS